jgi:endogenous inhibitor of DNA gyrase (YacG/DUF329 family)
MLQILVVLLMVAAGAFVVFSGEVRVDRHRVLPVSTARPLGIVFLGLATLPILLPVESGVVAMLVAFFVACGVALAFGSTRCAAGEAGGKAENARSGASLGVQRVGARCPQCERKIMTETESRSCAECGKPVHRDCHSAHRAAAHG